MTRKCGDELYRSPSTMSSGHISSLPDGVSGVGVPDLKRLGNEPGFHPVPRKETAGASKQKTDVAGKKPKEDDKLSKSSQEQKKGAAHASASKAKDRQGPVDRALQMLKPQKNKHKSERQK